MATEVVYSGHKVTTEDVTPVEDNVPAIKEAPRLENTSQLKSYLGMINYCHKFLTRLLTVFAPLRKMLAKNKPWNWFSEQDQEFYKSRDVDILYTTNALEQN